MIFLFYSHPHLAEIVADKNTYLLYPDDDAVPIEDIPHLHGGASYNLIVLDGTWKQARGIYCKNKFLQNIQKVGEKDKTIEPSKLHRIATQNIWIEYLNTDTYFPVCA